jgi:hypothetical protein
LSVDTERIGNQSEITQLIGMNGKLHVHPRALRFVVVLARELAVEGLSARVMRDARCDGTFGAMLTTHRDFFLCLWS